MDKGDNQAVVGNIEGAVGDLEAAVKDGILSESESQIDKLVCVAKQLAEDAIEQAIANGGDSDKIADAQDSLSEGDALGDSKDAVNKYKDALAAAEGA